MVINIQPFITGARLQLANPGSGGPNCILIIRNPNIVLRSIDQPLLKTGCGYITPLMLLK